MLVIFNYKQALCTHDLIINVFSLNFLFLNISHGRFRVDFKNPFMIRNWKPHKNFVNIYRGDKDTDPDPDPYQP